MAIPLIIAGLAAAGAAAGGGAGLASGVQTNGRRASGFYDPTGQKQTGYDPNAKYYNGSPTGLHDYNVNLMQKQNLVESRGPNLADYSQANMNAAQGQQARAGQASIAQMQAARAAGQVPSIAGMQAHQDMQRAQAAQQSAAASARGAGGLALAQQNAANNTANAQAQISGQAQINAANERLQAENAAAGTYSNLRGGDIGAQGQSAQQAQFQAGMQQTNRDSNDSRTMGYEALTARANEAQLNSQSADQNRLAAGHAAADSANMGSADRNAANTLDLFKTVIKSDERAKRPVSLYAPMKLPFELQKGGGGSKPKAKERAAANDATGFPEGMALVRGKSKGRDADPQMLDDRYNQQNAGFGAAQDVMPKSQLDDAIGAQAANDRIDAQLDAMHGKGVRIIEDEPPADPARAQWERINGPASRAEASVRNADNQAGAMQTQERLRGADGGTGSTPWWMTPVDTGGGMLFSDENAKEGASLEAANFNAFADPSGKSAPVGPGISRIQQSRGNEFMNQKPAMLSDEQTKDVLPLYEPPGKELHQSENGHAYLSDGPSDDDGRPSLARGGSGSTSQAKAKASPAPSRPKAAAPRKMTNDELMAEADALLRRQREEHEARMASGPAVSPYMVSDDRAKLRAAFRAGTEHAVKSIYGDDAEVQPWPDEDSQGPADEMAMPPSKTALPAPGPQAAIGFSAKRPAVDRSPVAEANRSMVGSAYAYKDGMTPPEQKPGEPNYGPMAQNIESTPVGATAVKTDPSTGLKVLDRDKLLKVVASGVADLQRQQDETRMVLAKGGRPARRPK